MFLWPVSCCVMLCYLMGWLTLKSNLLSECMYVYIVYNVYTCVWYITLSTRKLSGCIMLSWVCWIQYVLSVTHYVFVHQIGCLFCKPILLLNITIRRPQNMSCLTWHSCIPQYKEIVHTTLGGSWCGSINMISIES